MSRLLGAAGLVVAAVWGMGWVAAQNVGGDAVHSVGKSVPSFTLIDPRDQTKVAWDELKKHRAVVVVFLGTECPLNNLYMGRLAELHREYAARNVAFVGINANAQDTASRVADHARQHAVPFPVVKDAGNVVADQFGARRTPEAFVIDSQGIIRYQGRIDDQYGIGIQRPAPQHRDLAAALDAVLAGRRVEVSTTPVAGCLIGRARPPKATGTVTYCKDVARIVQDRCQSCHRPGQIGPMALMTFDDIYPWAETIREVVDEGRMPPWHADPRYGKFDNDLRLSPSEKETLLSWIDQGCPKGDERDLPPPRVFDSEWKIGKPDLILTMPEAFEVPARMPKKGVPYQHFVLDPQFRQDRWVVRAQARPGAPAVVHHMIAYILPPGQTFDPDDPDNLILCGFAPGDLAFTPPPGTAKKIPAGSKIVLQMHYTPNGTAQKDRSSIAMIFAKGPERLREVRTVPIFNAFFRIPPGAAHHRVEAVYRFERPVRLIGFMPHMHLRGKDFLYEAVFPDGTREILLSVPRFQFNWQAAYRLAEPRRIPKDTRIRCVAHYDNSANNPNNPDPTQFVFWGNQTWEEMMIGWVDFVEEDDGSAPRSSPAPSFP
ncbi:MAG: redoxin domain-containing protein [Gemmataceae bacterium]|nr:redoxin domain-containing protein [Gemmataceae bacterium]MDW8267451.1 redoxin domain-containing protein [Gemmataceae bacterium]